MRQHYERMGIRVGDEYESQAAKAAERAIHAEMLGSRR
jgi:hypothetical protein